jgi:hypothetical protein
MSPERRSSPVSLHRRKRQLPVSTSLFSGHCGKLGYRSSIQVCRLEPVVPVKPSESPVWETGLLTP